MAKKIVGSIVATSRKSGLKEVFHVHKDGGTITFTKPDNPVWSHRCGPSNERNKSGWESEVVFLGYADAKYFPKT